MEAILDYKVVNFLGKNHVVAFSDREEAFFNRKLTDENGNVLLDENGKQRKEKVISLAAPSYMGIKGLVLCGILRKNETLEQWIATAAYRRSF